MINPIRAIEVTKLLTNKQVKLSNDEFLLYGDMFEVMFQLTNGKHTTEEMFDAYDRLVDYLAGTDPGCAAPTTADKRIAAQIEFMGSHSLLNNLDEEERTLFAFCT